MALDLAAVDRMLCAYFLDSPVEQPSNWSAMASVMILGTTIQTHADQTTPIETHAQRMMIAKHRRFRSVLQQLPPQMLFLLSVYYDEKRSISSIRRALKSDTIKIKKLHLSDITSLAAMTPWAREKATETKQSPEQCVMQARHNRAHRAKLNKQILTMYNISMNHLLTLLQQQGSR